MTFEDIKKVNETLKLTNIKGKEYAEVNQRVKAFRMLYPDGFIHTEVVSHDGGIIVMKAECGYYEEHIPHILGTGTAFEDKNKGMINGTSYVENCETSAVGRALGMMGIGIDTALCSAEELTNAIAQQEPKKYEPKKKASDPLICSVCHNVILGFEADTPKGHISLTAEEVAERNKTKYGCLCCADCASKKAKAESK